MRYLSGLDPVLLHWDRGTFARAAGSDSHIWDAAKKRMYGPFGDGVPCIAIIGGKRWLQIEGARTNLMELLANWTYTSGASHTGGQVDPLGGTAASLLSGITTGSSAQGVLGGAANDTLVQLSMLVKKVKSGDMRWFGGGAALGDWNPVTLDGLAEWDRLVNHHSAVDEDDAWQANGSGALDIVLRAASGTMDLYALWPQMEEGAFPSSPIPSGAAAVTRNADSMSFSAAQIPAEFTSGKWSIEVTPMFSSADMANGTNHYLMRFGADDYLRIRKTSGGQVRVSLSVDGTEKSLVNSVFSRDQTFKSTVDLTDGSFGVEGLTSGDGTTSSGSSAGWPTDTTLFPGSNDGTSQHFFGRMAEPRRLAA